MDKKIISVVVPCYNEENSIEEMYSRVLKVFESLPKYDFELIFADDCSPDSTWEKIAEVCETDPRVTGYHNSTNFGPVRNIVQALKYANGDAAFLLMGDLQEPPETLPEFISYWENGYQVVVGVHPNTMDKGFQNFCRKVYYKLIDNMSTSKLIQGFAYFGLYSRNFLDVLDNIEDSQPYFPGIVAEYAGKIKTIEIVQQESKRGKSGQNFFKKYDQAMLGITTYTKLMLRIATFLGVLIGIFAFLIALFSFVMKLIFWDSYPMGMPTIIIGVFFLGAIQLFFMGILGEYVLSINERSKKRPLTSIDKSINIHKEDNS